MTLDAGKLRHRLVLLTPTQTQDVVSGEIETTWSELASVWGSFEPYSTKDMIAAASLQDKTSARAVVRFRSDVRSEMRVRFKERLYEIVGAPLADADSGREYMTLMLKELNYEPEEEVDSDS